MRLIRGFTVAFAFILAGSVVGDDKLPNKLPDAVAKALEKSGELQVYSLNGETNNAEGWHGAKVLGKTTVTKEDATKLADAVKKAVADGDRGARCFIPRHGIRAVYDGKTYDLVICFECGWVYIYTDKSDKPAVLMIAEGPQKAINKILTDAKVPLDKPEKK